MLQTIRDKATGIIGVTILVLISISFALWGVQNYFIGNVATTLASVGDIEIDVQDFEQRYGRYRSQLAAQGVELSVLDEPIRRREFLEAMIDDAVWRQAAAQAGVAVTPAAIREQIQAIEAFQIDGRFDSDIYLELLKLQGLTPQMLEADIRRSLLAQRIPEIVSRTAWAPEAEVTRLAALVDQRRSFAYVMLSADDRLAEIQVDDAAIEAYYEANRESFRSPEQVTIEYVEIEAGTYAEEIAVDEALLRELYERERGRFRTPERRLASHILIEVDAEADDAAVAAARKEAQALAARAQQGADFAALAREHSDDIVSAEDGGDLGWVSRGDMVEPFELALFELEEGAITEPVRTSFGFHVIALREIDPERGKTFEEAREDLAEEYREAEAERQFIGLQDELVELLNYSDAPDMEAVADRMGLTLSTAGPFSRAGGEGVAARREVIDAAFSETVLDEGLVSDPILLGPDHVLFLRVIEHQEASIQPLSEVRDEVLAAARRDAAREAMRASAEALLARAEAGAPLATLAADEATLTVEEVDQAGRFGGSTPPALVNAVFELPHPGDAPTVHLVAIDADRTALVELRSVSVADDANGSPTRRFVGLRATRSFSAAEVMALGEALRQAADVKVNERLLSAEPEA